MALLVDIEKRLGAFRLEVRLEAEQGVTALLGASGCGKSMTLKCIAGIEKPDRGHIELDGVTLFDSEKHICLKPQQRKVGYLFQQYALFPNMTVAQNIRCGLRDRSRAREVVPEIMRVMHLDGLENAHPGQLSGGQQQRVALARILVSEPRLLLLDEPFSALDSHLRFQLERELRATLERFGRPALLVSHDRDEVFRMSGRIAVMDQGHIEVCGTRSEIFADPVTRSGAVLTGCKNISPLERLPDGRLLACDWGFPLVLHRDPGRAGYVGIRMHDVRAAAAEGENVFLCRVAEEIENPFSYTVMLRNPEAGAGGLLGWELGKEEWRSLRGETVRIELPEPAILLLEECVHEKSSSL